MRNILWNKLGKIISPGVIQFLLAIFLVALILLGRLFKIPGINEIALFSKEMFLKEGLWILVVAAFIESIFMVGIYFPGSFVILIAVVTSDYSFDSLFMIAMYSFIGFMLANITNYFLGKYGYYKALLFLGKKKAIEQMEKWMSRRSTITFFLSAIHPNFLSLSIVCAGIAKERFSKTILIAGISLIFWITIWIIATTPFLRHISLKDESQSWYIVVVFVFWGLANIVLNQIRNRRKKNSAKKNVDLP